uniref:Nucleoside diphosphate kinase n=1 Tax=Parascaris univalens TaxID=6257 RepID=A0A915AX21_PARUN
HRNDRNKDPKNNSSLSLLSSLRCTLEMWNLVHASSVLLCVAELYGCCFATALTCCEDKCSDEAHTTGKKRSDLEMSKNERTFIAIKPDAVQRGLIGKVITRFEERGYKLVGMKMVHATRQHLEVHYQELKDKPFFKTLIDYMSSGPVVAMVWEGLDVVKQGRLMLGATNPLASNPGTIRGDYSIQTGRNIVHGSDSLESAKREIAHWFRNEELIEWSPANVNWVYE